MIAAHLGITTISGTPVPVATSGKLDRQQAFQNFQHGVIAMLHGARLHERRPAASRGERLDTSQTTAGLLPIW
jgi:hypothetical protein